MNTGSISQKLDTLLSKVHYKNFKWHITWNITSVCNLRCVYCPVIKQRTHPNIEKAARKMIKLNPKSITLTGGEPLLVPNLKFIIQEIKRGIDPCIIINTNGTMPQQLISILPHIDVVDISVDGLGEVNKWTRGINGDEILSFIKECAVQIKQQNLETYVRTISVITNQNFLHFSSLAKKLHDINPNIRVHATHMKPYTHPLSLVNNIANYKAFFEMIQRLESDNFNVRLEGPFLNQGQQKEVKCYRQFFKAWLSQDGDFVTCKPPAYVKYYYHELRKAISNKYFSRSISLLRRMIDTCLIHKYDPSCPFPCDCGEYLENILLARSVNKLPEEYCFLAPGILKDGSKEAYDFIRKYINDKFVPKFSE
ncbi:radical SAM protein [Chloroflexota bacterium]